jgi:hypothetical protein
MTQKQMDFKKALFEFFKNLCDPDWGIKLIKDDSGHYISDNGKRLGRDIEVYNFMAKISGHAFVLATILEEILLPLKSLGYISLYESNFEIIKNLGIEIIENEYLEDWEKLCKELK